MIPFKTLFIIVTLLSVFLKGTPLQAQLSIGGGTKPERTAEEILKADEGPKMGRVQTTECVAGIRLTGGNGASTKLTATVVVPREWPEQTVRIVKEEIPPTAKVRYEDVGNGAFTGARLMQITIPKLAAEKKVHVSVTFEVTRHEQIAPTDTSRYSIPKTSPKDVRVHLQPSPKIESKERKFRDIFKEVTQNKETDWEKIEAVYTYTREKVKYREELKNAPVKGAVAVLKDGEGDCEDMCALFVAICRAGEVPARTVFVKGHCYAEFYLIDENKEGHWFPCQVSGSYAFGGMPDTRYIVQKGDNFRIDREQLRFVNSVFTGEIPEGVSPPKYQFLQIR
ncbi:MAG: transglutaminase domain-containing protein [Planctomycetaceae bacterium]|jgi:hypothetical protein|nr:transglutaminase domain-containing protein [Planctomycetaceae bacterium]